MSRLFRQLQCVYRITGLMILLIVVNSASSLSAQDFEKDEFPTGLQPVEFAVGDLNGDGRDDLVTANLGADSVSVHIANTDGSFRAAGDFPTGAQPRAVFIADFNRDGRRDVATANLADDTISVLFGNGDGTLAAKIDYPTGSRPSMIFGGDFTDDGVTDLATSNEVSGDVTLLRNLGAGTFAAPIVVAATDHAAENLAAGDFNRDGMKDLVFEERRTSDVADIGDVKIALRTGSGTFAPAQAVRSGPPVTGLTVADWDGDGWDDIAFGFHGGRGGDSKGVGILLNERNGTFTGGVGFNVGVERGAPSRPIIADLNQDGINDMAAAFALGEADIDGTLQHWLLYFFGTSDHTLGPLNEVPLGQAGSADTTSGDFNADGRPDLAVAGSVSSTVITLLNTIGCAPPSAARTVKICAPQDGATVDSPVRVSAAARPGSTAVTRMNVWIDGTKKFEQLNTTAIDTQIPMSAGTHRVTVQATDADGTFKTTVHITVGSDSACPAPSTARTVNICQPSDGATVDSPVRISAAANPGGSAISRMNVWVDGAKRFEQLNTSTIDTDVSMSQGTHRVTVQAADADGTFKTTVHITVESGSACPAPSTNRTVNICEPADGATVESPMRVHATAFSSSGVRFSQIYVDGQRQFHVEGASVDTSLAMPAGTRRITVQSKDNDGVIFKKTVHVTVR